MACKPSSTPPLASMESVKTPAERAREKSLLDDPLAVVLSPACVECQMCQKKIKLSGKSAYDTFHWRNHRARCLKTKKNKTKTLSRPMDPATLPPKSPKRTTTQNTALPPDNRLHDMPLLVRLEGEEPHHNPPTEAQPPSPLTTTIPLAMALYAPQAKSTISSTNRVIDEYMIRSHPECVRTSTAIALGDNGRNWTWKQLKPPRFAVYYEDGKQSPVVVDPERERQAVRILSMLYHSR